MLEILLWLLLVLYFSTSTPLLFLAAKSNPQSSRPIMQVWGLISLIAMTVAVVGFNRLNDMFVWDQYAVFFLLYFGILILFRRRFLSNGDNQ